MIIFVNFKIKLKRKFMAIKKKNLKTKPISKVTFTYDAPEASEIFLVGDFNKWNAESTPLKKLKKGPFKTIVDLEIGKSYEYKYIVDGVYQNDQEPDALIFNKYANAENSLIKL